MSEHLSDLALDRLAARGVEHAHLPGCEACRARLESFRARRERSLADPHFARIQASLAVAPRRRWLAIGLALAAAVVAVAFIPSPRSSERPKGRAILQLLTERGEAAGPVRPGERVGLTVNGAGHAFVLVLAQSRDGGLEQVWPVRGGQSGAIPPGAARLEPPFEVTPGSAHLVAIFSDAPLDAAGLARGDAGNILWPRLPGEATRADVELVVEEDSR